ncbi:MAG: sulfurtransferase TusA family protein [Planctomycetota bacterium]
MASLTAEETARAEALIRELKAGQGLTCGLCQRPICAHETLINIALGTQDLPQCCTCLATAQRTTRQGLRDRIAMYIHSRPCYRLAWAWADNSEGAAGNLPACLWSTEEATAMPEPEDLRAMTKEIATEAEWDAGELGCGDLALELRIRLNTLAPGAVLKVLARDGGAPEDVPAWCRLTGHTLVAARPPEYFIKRKEH